TTCLSKCCACLASGGVVLALVARPTSSGDCEPQSSSAATGSVRGYTSAQFVFGFGSQVRENPRRIHACLRSMSAELPRQCERLREQAR
ncbi:hypothetical protein EDB89DRAFT_1998679, partial [Lactarius sanguifluus]